MSLLPQNATFEELVQDCFLAHRGAGLMLSPLDVQLVMEWAEAGVPFEIVARGIRRAAERVLWDARPGEPALRSLRACRREVEAEIKKWRARNVGAHVEGGPGAAAASDEERSSGAREKRSFEEERHKKLRAALLKLARENAAVAPAVEKLCARVLVDVEWDLHRADRREELVVAALLRTLPFPERLTLYREATAHSGDPKLTSAHARKLSRRFHRHALVRRALALPSFW